MSSKRKRTRKPESSSKAASGNGDPKTKPAASELADSANGTSESELDTHADTAVSDFLTGLPSLSRITSVLMLLVGILIVGLLFYKVMVGFFIPLFMAAALVVIFRPVHEWFVGRFGNRKRLAAISTTMVILSIVLVPILLLISIAISQLTGLVSKTDLNDIKSAVQRARVQFGMQLEHADQFRRLDELTGKFDDIDAPEEVLNQIEEAKGLLNFLEKDVRGESPTGESSETAIKQLQKFKTVVQQIEVNADRPAEKNEVRQQDENADQRLEENLVQQNDVNADQPPRENDDQQLGNNPDQPSDENGASDPKSDPKSDPTSDLAAIEGRFHSQSVVASAAIHAWMNKKLGGSFRTQVKLFSNPSEKDLADSVRAVREYLQPRFVKLTGVTGKVLVQLLISLMIMVISIYFFFVDGPGMIRTLMRLSPLDDAYELRLLGEFEKTSRAVVLASVLSALVQGFLAAVAFYFCGLQSVILLFMVTTVMALIPFLGAASVWVPCAIYLGAVEQRYGVAIFLAIYGAAVVSSIDNVIKAYVLHGHSELHPLIALLSVLGGVPVFGPIGILIGPMVVVFLQTLLEILNHELVSPDRPQGSSTGGPSSGNLSEGSDAADEFADSASNPADGDLGVEVSS